jgi:hypothetical protein
MTHSNRSSPQNGEDATTPQADDSPPINIKFLFLGLVLVLLIFGVVIYMGENYGELTKPISSRPMDMTNRYTCDLGGSCTVDNSPICTFTYDELGGEMPVNWTCK